MPLTNGKRLKRTRSQSNTEQCMMGTERRENL
jgi:hypothetical protein